MFRFCSTVTAAANHEIKTIKTFQTCPVVVYLCHIALLADPRRLHDCLCARNCLLCLLQAMLDVAANEGWLVTAISICNLVQMIVQGRWLHDSSLLTLPHVEQRHLGLFR